MQIRYSPDIIRSIKKWHADFEMDGMLPSGFVERQLLDLYFNRRLEYGIVELLEEISLLRSGSQRILDVGSGMGALLSVLAEKGYRCHGVESSFEGCRLSKAMLAEVGQQANRTICARDDHLPFAKKQFDVVTSITVLEHVADASRHLSESMRVLKPQGAFFLFVPNFRSFWEGHYKLFFPPFLLSYKPLFRVYLKMRGRNVAGLDSINFDINPGTIARLLKRARLEDYEEIGHIRFRALFENPARIANQRIAWAVKLIRRFQCTRLLARFGLNLMSKLQIHTPLIYIIRKPRGD